MNTSALRWRSHSVSRNVQAGIKFLTHFACFSEKAAALEPIVREVRQRVSRNFHERIDLGTKFARLSE